MTQMRRYRAVAVEITCRDHERPLYWESYMTMTDDELRRRSIGWATGVWACDPLDGDHEHAVTIIEVSQVSTGARRG